MLVKLKDISKVVGGATPSTQVSEYYNGNIVWITPKDLADNKDNKYIDCGERNITKLGFEKSNTHLIPPNNILISTRAPIGYMAINRKECCTNQGFKSLICNINLVNVDFLYYYLKTKIKALESLGTGTTFKEVSKEAVENFEIDLPPLEIQDKIANILSNIDNQIERNNAMSKRLQVLAQTTYSRWFNQFEYPNNNEKKVFNKQLNKEIPTSFTVKSLGDIIVESKKSTIQVGEARLENGNYPFFTSGAEILPYKDYFVDGAYCFLNTGGNADVKFYEGKSAYSTDTWCLSANEYSYWLYLYLESIKSNMDQLFFSGSGLKHLQKDVFKKQVICLPNKELIEQFNLIVSKLFKYQSKIIQENKELVALKDRLLPLLINGQLNI